MPMPTTGAEAIRLLSEAGVEITPDGDKAGLLTRVEICRRLMAYCRADPEQRARLRWDSPVLGLRDDGASAEWFVREAAEDLLGLEGSEDAAEIGGQATRAAETFGEVMLHLEACLRDLWWSGSREACPSQAVFYELRRAISAQGTVAASRRLRPRSRLYDCLPAARSESIGPFLQQRFGVRELPIEDRVFGAAVLELGATWLALWFPCFLYLLVVCADPGFPHSWFWPGLLLPPLLIAVLLGLLSRPTWMRVRTLGDLTHWLLRKNEQVVERVKLAGEKWA
jgi:hypothetical protein